MINVYLPEEKLKELYDKNDKEISLQDFFKQIVFATKQKGFYTHPFNLFFEKDGSVKIIWSEDFKFHLQRDK